MAAPWHICDKRVAAEGGSCSLDPLAVTELSRPQPVDAMTLPSNRTASGFAVRQEETWVVFVQLQQGLRWLGCSPRASLRSRKVRAGVRVLVAEVMGSVPADWGFRYVN